MVQGSYFNDLAALFGRSVCAAGGREEGLDGGIRGSVALIAERTSRGGAVMLVGNGGSAAIASHVAVDFFKAGVRATAFNDGPMLTCMGNDFGYEQIFSKPVEFFARPGDVLLAISSSGRSVNILNAARSARERGCAVITLSGFAPDNPLRTGGDINFYVPSPSYGLVETVHMAICHGIFDTFMQAGHGPLAD